MNICYYILYIMLKYCLEQISYSMQLCVYIFILLEVIGDSGGAEMYFFVFAQFFNFFTIIHYFCHYFICLFFSNKSFINRLFHLFIFIECVEQYQVITCIIFLHDILIFAFQILYLIF